LVFKPAVAATENNFLARQKGHENDGSRLKSLIRLYGNSISAACAFWTSAMVPTEVGLEEQNVTFPSEGDSQSVHNTPFWRPFFPPLAKQVMSS
jgi:hypothetical protein